MSRSPTRAGSSLAGVIPSTLFRGELLPNGMA